MRDYEQDINLHGDEAVFWQMLREFIQTEIRNYVRNEVDFIEREQARDEADEAVEYYLDNHLDQKLVDWMHDNLADEISNRLTVTIEVD